MSDVTLDITRPALTLDTTGGTKGDTGSAGTSAAVTFANAAARALAVPAFLGQLGLQLDTVVAYYGTALTAGSWTVCPPAMVGAMASNATPTPAAHAASHVTGQPDALTPANIGADATGTAQGLITSHTHAGTTNGPQLAQANTHGTPDTDSATTALHHTLGTGATQGAAGTHLHTGTYAPVTSLQPLGSVSGAVSLACVPGNAHTITLTNNLTSWTFTGLNDGDIAQVRITNGSGYSVAATGLTAYETGALPTATLAAAYWRLTVARDGATYYGRASKP
jgi:hypothetical protein